MNGKLRNLDLFFKSCLEVEITRVGSYQRLCILKDAVLITKLCFYCTQTMAVLSSSIELFLSSMGFNDDKKSMSLLSKCYRHIDVARQYWSCN